jgi:Tol biopolymer transport system component
VFAYTVVDPSGAAATANAHVGVGTFPAGAPLESFATADLVTVNNPEFAPSISSDGRFIAFTTSSALVADDTNTVTDVYLYDRGTRTLSRVSVASDGTQGNGASQRPSLSADGRYVVFESIASNLVAGDTNAVGDVFRHDRLTGETIRISVATGGAQGNGVSNHARISDDGNTVAFSSIAFNLVANDANGAFDVFVRDVAAATTERVSVTATGGEADLGVGDLALSGDGHLVAFGSLATNLVAGDTNNASDVFVRDRTAGTTTRVSVSSTGNEANAACSRPAISQDGRFVSFLSTATTLVSGAPAVVTQVYVRDLQASTTTRPITQSSTSAAWSWLSGNGRFLTLLSTLPVIGDRFAAASLSLGTELARLFPVVSSNGNYVVVLNNAGSPGTIVVMPNPFAPAP